MPALVLAVLVPSDASDAVTVCVPVVLSVTLKFFVPTTSAAFDGRTAFESDEVMPTVSVTLVIKFQFASTALTVTVNATAACCAVGEPVLPVALPGAAVSPGARICNLLNAPAPTVMDGQVEDA